MTFQTRLSAMLTPSRFGYNVFVLFSFVNIYMHCNSVLFWINFLEMILNTFNKTLFDFAIW